VDAEINHIGIVLFADVEEFDAIGPWEVHGGVRSAV